LIAAVSAAPEKMTTSKILERRKRFGIHEEIKARKIHDNVATQLSAEQLAKREKLLAMVKKNSSSSSSTSSNSLKRTFKKWTPEDASLKKTLSNSLPTTP